MPPTNDETALLPFAQPSFFLFSLSFSSFPLFLRLNQLRKLGKTSRVTAGLVQSGHLVLFRRRVTLTTGLFSLFSLTTYPFYSNWDFVSIDGRLQLYIS